jgi:glutamate 5-kinase
MVNCYEGLLNEGIIPIANEDDAVSLTMSMFSDNDELASLVAQLVNADMLILLTDINGLYTGHPDDPKSKLIHEVTPEMRVEKYVRKTNKGEGEGRGGMKSKLRFAKAMAKKGITTYIANGNNENTIIDIIDGKDVGTKFVSNNLIKEEIKTG